MSISSVLITGQTGFIGRVLYASLAASSDFAPVGASLSTGIDLENPDALAGIGDVDVIVHLAGLTGVRESWEHPARFHRTNFLATLNTLEHARRNGARVIMISSYMYGEPKNLPIDENHPVSWRNPYGASKFISEEICRSYSKDFNLDIDVLRPFNVYGPGQGTNSLVGLIVEQALHATEIAVEELSPKRDYLFVDDLVSAITGLMSAKPNGYRTFNVGTGISHSVKDVIDTVLEITQLPLPIRSKNIPRKNQIDDCYADTRHLFEVCGWRPSFDLRMGLRKIITQSN